MALRFAPTRGAGAVTLNALIRGPQGVAATVAAGTATTGAAGSSAAVANSGSSGAAVFDFTIPRGADAGMRYAFEASTVMAAPASGGVRKNNATLSLVTAFAVNATNSDGSDVSDFIATWDDSTNSTKGSLVVRKEGSGAVLGVFAITSIVDNTTWLQINVTYVSGSGTLTAADPVYLTANLTGDKGTNGTVAIGGTPSANQIATWSNSTTVQGVSITGLVKGNGASAPAAAVVGTDYAGPTSGSVPLKGNGAGGFSAALAADVETLFALGNWKVDYLNGSNVRTAIALGADKTLFASNGASSAPTMRTAASLGILEFGVTATITKGFTVAPNNLGNITSFTVDPTLGNYQYGTNHGAATWTAPTNDCAVDILVTNDGTAGSITFSGFTVGSSTGSALTTTNTNKFIVSVRRVNAISTYSIYALQ